MIVEPKTPLGVPARDPRVDGTELAEQVVPGYGDDLGVWIEGVATDPRSATGRTVMIHIPASQLHAVMRLIRHAMIDHRSAPMS
jgi:hypothetical protein